MAWGSWALVAVQVACLAGIALSGPWIARNPLLLALEVAGFGLGMWAVWTMRLGNFNVVPNVKEGARLVRSGPYALIRHPMYSSLLLVSGALVLDEFTWVRAGMWVALLVDLVIKLRYEEHLLAQVFGAYEEYRRGSYRLIPWVY